MKIEPFELERGQSRWENVVDVNLSDSSVHPLTLAELAAMGLDLAELEATPLAYVQSNGSVPLRRRLAQHYRGAGEVHVEVTTGTSEANFVLAQVLLERGDRLLYQAPNYLQLPGLARHLGAEAHSFSLRPDVGWEPDWEDFERGLELRPRLIYISHPNNPSGYVASRAAMERIVAGADSVGAWLLADEVFRGAELDGNLSPTFWGLSDRVVVSGGLSKAYGLPGVRIGWIVAPPQIVERCWACHDYTTIAPSALSDLIARFAVRPEIQQRLFARARGYMVRNRDVLQTWVESLGGTFEYCAPQAGAYAFLRCRGDAGSVEWCDRLRDRCSVLLVPGASMGMDGYLRIGLGSPPQLFDQGLRRIGAELAEPAASR